MAKSILLAVGYAAVGLGVYLIAYAVTTVVMW